MDIKYYIRTTGERILDESYNQIPYVKLIDKEHRYIDFFVDELERIGNEDCVIIEDDCVLCKDFKNRIEEVIAQYPDRVINFFYWATKYFKTHEDFDYYQNQCTYYPKGFSQTLAREMRKVHKEFPELCTDQCESKALKNLGVKHIQYRPCLVQHLNFDSLLNHKTEDRGLRTPYFIDYLDELGFNYDKLNFMHLKPLNDKMHKHIEGKRIEWLKNKELSQRVENDLPIIEKPKKIRKKKEIEVKDDDKILSTNN